MVGEAAVAAGVLGASLAVKAYTNIYALEVNSVELSYSSLPASFDGFKILHFTDLHTTKWGRMEELIISRVKSNPADLAVFTGDLVTTESGLDPFCRLLRFMVDMCPTYISFGNTEHKYWERKTLTGIFESTGAKVLVNASEVIEKGSDRIHLVGVDDPYTGHARLGEALSGVPEDGFNILLAHAPTIIDEAVDQNVSLVLSGHTHGGQVRLPFVGAIKKHLPKYRELVMGLFSGDKLRHAISRDPGETTLYVSRGVGSSYFPIRFMCPPEIPLFILRRS